MATIDLLDDGVNYLDFCPELPNFEGRELGEKCIFPYKTKLREGKKIGNFLDLDPGLLVADSYAMLKLKSDLLEEIEFFSFDINGFRVKNFN